MKNKGADGALSFIYTVALLMTDRERKLVSSLFIALGALGLLAAGYALLTGASPPPTNSLLRAGLADLLRALLGQAAGNATHHIIFGGLAGGMLWLGLRLRRDG